MHFQHHTRGHTYPWKRDAKRLARGSARRDEGGKGKDRAFQHQWCRMQHRGKERGQYHKRGQYGSHPYTGKVEESMRRGMGMARAGCGLPMIKRRRVDLANKPCPHSETDEQKSKNLTCFARHHGSHKRPLGEDVSLPWLFSHRTRQERTIVRGASVPSSSQHCQGQEAGEFLPRTSVEYFSMR